MKTKFGTSDEDKTTTIKYKNTRVEGLEIFYREAGDPSKQTILLLHGFPSSSHMFRDLIPKLADEFHVVAPDYPGYGYSSAPSVTEFSYSFERLTDIVEGFSKTIGLKDYVLYMQDYGGPVGFRLAVRSPEKIKGLIIQNANAYEEGLPDSFWAPIREYWSSPTPELRAKLLAFFSLDMTKWQYTVGAKHPEKLNPDAWIHDQSGLDRAGNKEIQIELLKDYGSNLPLYPSWQKYFRDYQPKTLVVWGKNDPIFPAAGAEPYRRDLRNIDFNLLDAGHFALEENVDFISGKIRNAFLK